MTQQDIAPAQSAAARMRQYMAKFGFTWEEAAAAVAKDDALDRLLNSEDYPEPYRLILEATIRRLAERLQVAEDRIEELTDALTKVVG